MNPLVKDAGLLIIGVIGLLMILSRLATESPSNAFLGTTAVVCIVGLIGYLVMNHIMSDD